MLRRLLKLTAKQITDDQIVLLFRDLDADDSGTLAMEVGKLLRARACAGGL